MSRRVELLIIAGRVVRLHDKLSRCNAEAMALDEDHAKWQEKRRLLTLEITSIEDQISDAELGLGAVVNGPLITTEVEEVPVLVD